LRGGQGGNLPPRRRPEAEGDCGASFQVVEVQVFIRLVAHTSRKSLGAPNVITIMSVAKLRPAALVRDDRTRRRPRPATRAGRRRLARRARAFSGTAVFARQPQVGTPTLTCVRPEPLDGEHASIPVASPAVAATPGCKRGVMPTGTAYTNYAVLNNSAQALPRNERPPPTATGD
jgi:hypothetical protein